MGLGLVLHTMWGVERDPTEVWKNSSLAVMYHGLRDVDECTRVRTMGWDGMEESAKDITVTLKGTAMKRA